MEFLIIVVILFPQIMGGLEGGRTLDTV